MSARKIIVAGIACSAMFAGGCVSSGTYTTKEQEAQQLSKDLQTSRSSYTELLEKQNTVLSENSDLKKKVTGLEEKYEKALTENSDLKKQVAGLEEQGQKIGIELDALKVKHEKLVAENRPENLLKKIGERFTELQQAIDKLQAENETLQKKVELGKELATKATPKVVDRKNPEKEETVPAKLEPVKAVPVITEPAKAAPLEPEPFSAK